MEESEKSKDEDILPLVDKDEVTPEAVHTEEKHLTALPVLPSRSHHDDWTGAGSRAGWGAGEDSKSGLSPQTSQQQFVAYSPF